MHGLINNYWEIRPRYTCILEGNNIDRKHHDVLKRARLIHGLIDNS